jgi:anti-anti-sigma factor
MQQNNDIRIENRGEFTLFDIRGDLTAASEPALTKAYSDADEAGAARILLRFEEGAYINSGGIAVLIQILAQTRQKQQQIGITGISEHFKKIFNMVGITKFAKIYNTEEVALETLTA